MSNVNFSEVLISPPAKFIREMGASIADAQRQLDEAALAAQAHLEKTSPGLAAAGYAVTWYQIPEAEVEIKMALHFEQKAASSPARLYLAPFNAKYRSTLGFSAQGASTVKLKVVPVPPATLPTDR